MNHVRVLVTDGGGALGRAAVSALARSGRSVRALVAPADPPPLLATEVVTADPTDAGGLAAACDGVDAVVHLTALRAARPGHEGPAVLATTLRLLAALPPGCRLVHAGSTALYGHARPWPADVSTSPDPRTPAGHAHAEAERQVRAHAAAVVVRLAPVYTADTHEGPVSAARWFAGRGVVPGSGATRVHLLHADDAAAGLVAALDAGEGTYLLAGPQPVTAAELVALLARVDGRAPPSRYFPAIPARRAAAAYERRAWRRDHPGAFGKRPRPRGHSANASPPCTTADAVDALTRDRAFSWARAAEGLGWRPRVGLEDGLHGDPVRL